ncbi:unnamed protein product [Closterium sp. Naga37s-1]|nr:unnamed protein product [Closterium sp. Naga37s-1]
MPPYRTTGSPSNFTPATPLVAPSPQLHDRGPEGEGVLPGMIPTPFLPTCDDINASGRDADTGLGGAASGHDVAGHAMAEIQRLWAQVQAVRGTGDPAAGSAPNVPNFTLGEDVHAALAGMNDLEAEVSGKVAGDVTPGMAAQPPVWRPHGRAPDAPQQSGVRRDATPATQAPTRPARAASKLPPLADAFERPNRGFELNRLAGAGRLANVGNPMARRVGGVGVGTETGMAGGSVAPDGGGTPPAIQFYVKKAMHLLLRSCAAHGVTYWPTDDERNVALLVVLRCHYDVCQLDVDRAMENGAYCKVVNKIWSKFRSDSLSQGRQRIVDGLEIAVAAPGIYKLVIDIDTKKSLWGRYAPSECSGMVGEKMIGEKIGRMVGEKNGRMVGEKTERMVGEKMIGEKTGRMVGEKTERMVGEKTERMVGEKTERMVQEEIGAMVGREAGPMGEQQGE